MQQICPLCKQFSADGNLWCQEIDCPAGHLSPLLAYGAFLGNIQVIRLLRNWNTAALYHAQRDGIPVLLKVANAGYEEHLKEEAYAWRALQNARDPVLPAWLPHGAENKEDAFGIATVGDQARYYFLLEFAKGEFLTDYLLDNPQPWHKHVGWFMSALARGISRVNQTGWLDLNLTPETIMVVLNGARIPQPVLVDLGLLTVKETPPNSAQLQQIRRRAIPGYVAPEVADPKLGKLTEATDVYGLGLILYEMLAGHSALPTRPQSRQPGWNSAPPTRLELPKRLDLAKQQVPLTTVLKSTIERVPDSRYRSAAELGQTLSAMYGPVPDKRRAFELNQKQTLIAIVVLLLIVIAIIVMLVLSAVTVKTI